MTERGTNGSRTDSFVPTAVVAQSLGRNLAGSAAFATIKLGVPGSVLGDRVNHLDLLAGKVMKCGRLRAQLSVDL